MTEHNFELKKLQEIVDLGEFRLERCTACRGVTLAMFARCQWCAAPIHATRADGGAGGRRTRPSARLRQGKTPHKRFARTPHRT